jgi:cyclophilin family peptidyl-prolyl cis-trans isomerase
MSNKKRTTKPVNRRASQSARAAQVSQRTTWLILVAFLVVGLIIGLWIVFSNRSKTASAPTAAPGVSAKTYSAPPAMTIDPKKQYFANFKMANGGEFTVQLFPDKAPKTVNNFVFLAREGYYNGTTFHRVLEGFMAQGGDPTGTGTGGPGYQFANEDSDLTFDKSGVIAMANAGRDTNGSQFFITFAPQPQLNGDYTIFGQVVSGMDVVNKIRLRDPQQNPNYPGDAIQTVTITEK